MQAQFYAALSEQESQLLEDLVNKYGTYGFLGCVVGTLIRVSEQRGGVASYQERAKKIHRLNEEMHAT